jgi:hypothetical protein
VTARIFFRLKHGFLHGIVVMQGVFSNDPSGDFSIRCSGKIRKSSNRSRKDTEGSEKIPRKVKKDPEMYEKIGTERSGRIRIDTILS